jgi:Raf kinase inhibitor-like YbhB/YbcL family protein
MATSQATSNVDKLAGHILAAVGSRLTITSSSFGTDQPIPTKYTPLGANISPALSWSVAPAGTRELVLICEDPDAPMPRPFVHWILHGLPANAASLPEGVPTEGELKQLGSAVQGQNDFKTRGWNGPKPPPGHGVHHYHFQLFALDTSLKLEPDTPLDVLVKSMKGHVLAQGEVVGTFERKA